MIKMEQSRQFNDDGTFTDWTVFNFPSTALRLIDANQTGTMGKLQDVAHYRWTKACARGVREPVIVTFALLEQDQPAARYFPRLSAVTDEGERLISANSLITYVMRTLFERNWIYFEEGVWQLDVPNHAHEWQQRGQAVLQMLLAERRLCLEAGGQTSVNFAQTEFEIDQDVVPVAGCAFLSTFVARHKPRLAFNTAYFLLEHDDIFHHHSALGEAHSFWMEAGVLRRPPLFRRGAIWQRQDGSWTVGYLGMEDVGLRLPGNLRLVHHSRSNAADEVPFALNEDRAAPIVLYTRYFGVASRGSVLGATPVEAGRVELTVLDRRVVGWSEGGGTVLPHNGFVISIAPQTLTDQDQQALLTALQTNHHIDLWFTAPELNGMRQGIQAGPLLLIDGASPLTNTYLERVEQFWPSQFVGDGTWQIGVVSTNYRTDVDTTRAGRAALGIDQAGDLLAVMAAGVNDGMAIPGVDSAGATLCEIATVMRQHGAVAAVNLDGGGSTQAYYEGREAVVPGDRRGVPGRRYERLVPSLGVVG